MALPCFHSMPFRRWLALWCCCLSVACRTPEPTAWRIHTDHQEVSAAAFPGASLFSAGFDAWSHDRPWQAGDEVLFGLRLQRAERAQHWLLHLRVSEPQAMARAGDAGDPGTPLAPIDWHMRINGEMRNFPSALCRVEVTVCDERGTVLGKSEPLLPWQLLARGLQPACELVAGRRRGGREIGEQPLAEALVCAVALLQIVQADDVLAPLLWQVVQRPSLWSVISNLGATVVVRPAFESVDQVAPKVAGQSNTWRVPMTLSVNDTVALQLSVFADRPVRPFALCGGIVGATARHPTDAGVEFSLLLLAAHYAQ